MINSNNFIATKNIEVGKEVVFNYLNSEAILPEPFEYSNCGQKVLGKQFIERFPFFYQQPKSPIFIGFSNQLLITP